MKLREGSLECLLSVGWTIIRSKSLTMAQACMAAAVMEFAGAVAVGARTAVRFHSHSTSSLSQLRLTLFHSIIVYRQEWYYLSFRLPRRPRSPTSRLRLRYHRFRFVVDGLHQAIMARLDYLLSHFGVGWCRCCVGRT